MPRVLHTYPHISRGTTATFSSSTPSTNYPTSDKIIRHAKSVGLYLSRTRDLVDQIKQITIEIRDIKERRKTKIDLAKVSNTINVHNRTQNGPLQDGHVEHDEDDVHYEDSI